MWKGALQKAGILDGAAAKEKKAAPRVIVNEADKNRRDLLSCDILIKMKVPMIG